MTTNRSSSATEPTLLNEVRAYKGELCRFETRWGVHTVRIGKGKYANQFIGESIGWGGKRGYWHVFPSYYIAREYVARQCKPSDEPADISIFG